MKIIFAGTPEFAAVALARLIDAGFDIALVLTQPDRPAGRGMRMTPSPVKQLASAAGVDIFQPASLKRDASAVARLLATPHDAMVVAAYGLILPQEVLNIASRACLNIHASLLPRWRGAAPIQRAIEAGDTRTGVCIMRMEAGLDTGPVLLSQGLPIGAHDTAGTLNEALAQLGAEMIVQALHRLDVLAPVPQAESGVTYASKIGKTDAVLDFRKSAPELERKVRAFDPHPGASATVGNTTIKIWRAQAGATAAGGTPGVVLKADGAGIVVACGGGALVLTQLQKPGAKRLPARDFLQGYPLVPGTFFQLPPPVQS